MRPRILLVTDAWHPQINGVVQTLSTIVSQLSQLHYEIRVISPQDFSTIPVPTYPEIRLAYLPYGRFRQLVSQFQPHAIHIATEGPLGMCARHYCQKRGLPFTTSFHTRFPEYLKTQLMVPQRVSHAFLRWFHQASSAVMVSTDTMMRELAAKGFTNLVRWSRGVDLSRFQGQIVTELPYPKPIHLYVGRIAAEKNLEAFLSLNLPGTKLLVGGGPALELLRKKYPQAVFVGPCPNDKLQPFYAGSDVFVFPSKTDTFGLVMLEAMACGLPVAAYPVPGPIDVVGPGGYLHTDLAVAIEQALHVPPSVCRHHAVRFSWDVTAQQFLSYLQFFTEADQSLPSSA